jgi:hypothetical protein
MLLKVYIQPFGSPSDLPKFGKSMPVIRYPFFAKVFAKFPYILVCPFKE